MENEAKKRGVPIKIEIADNTVELQTQQIKSLISQGIRVLIITPCNSAAMGQAVDMAKKAGIKVISYVRLTFNCDLDLYISSDNIRIGQIQGRFIITAAPKGNYIIMS